MKLRSTFTAMSTSLLALCSAAVFAQTSAPAEPAAAAATPRVDQRQANQSQRIEQGKASGELTARETRRLNRQQMAVSAAENKAKADGSVTAQERKRLHRLQDHTSQNIRQQKHDRQSRPTAAQAAGK